MTNEEIAKMVEFMKHMKLSKPKLDTEEDFKSWMSGTVVNIDPSVVHMSNVPLPPPEVKTEDVSDPPNHMPPAPSSDSTLVYSHHFPKLSQYSGDDSKGVPYSIWKQEVLCLKSEGHTDTTILQAIRTSLKGNALKQRTKAGPNASVEEIIKKLDIIFGPVQPKDIRMKKFFNAKQGDTEDVVNWSCRLTDIYDEALEGYTFDKVDYNNTLRTVFYSGLRQSLKDITGHLFLAYTDYDSLIREIRCKEEETKVVKQKTSEQNKHEKATAKAAIPSTATSEVEELKAMIRKMDATLKNVVEQQQQQPQQHASYVPQPFHQQQRGRRRTRGRGGQQETTYNQHEEVTCYRCGQEGHFAIGCRVNLGKGSSDRSNLNFHRPFGRGKR